MAITNGYTTQAAFKTFASLSSSSHNDDIDRAIEAASRAVDRFCGRRFYADAVVSARYYTAEDALLLSVFDVSTATGLVVKTDDNWDGTYENTWTINERSGSYGFLVEPANAAADGLPFTRLRATVGAWPVSLPDAVEVTAKWGIATCPTDVVQATLLLAARLFKRKDTPFGTMGQEGVGIVTLPKVDADVARLLAPYRRMDLRG